jgi:SurA-like N-terminal domain
VRRAAVVGFALAAIVAGVVTYLAVRSGDGDPVVAHVAGEPIRKSQLESVVHHFRLEAEAAGRPFPAESTPGGRQARNRLLGLLVYRAELRQAARRLRIQVTRVQVLRRLNASSGGEEATPDAFAYGSVEAQLLYERIYAKVTRGIRQAARRNAAMTRFVKRLQQETKVRYEPGYAPGS